MGLVDLYRITKKQDYLDLAKQFVLNRGVPGGIDQNQNRVALADETMAVGHAVCGPYLWCGAMDVFSESGDQMFIDAVKRIWDDANDSKMYVCGTIGQYHKGTSPRGDPVAECFGEAYDLPNFTVYGETCANICNAMWSWRMLSATGDCKYADMLETVLYNSGLSGMSIDGTKFRYVNPMAVDKPLQINSNDTAERWSFFHCWCCPPNVTRTLAGLHQWVASEKDSSLYIHFYNSCTITTSTATLVIDTKYPWDQTVTLTVKSLASPRAGAFNLRIPSWVSGATVTINGSKQMATPGSYFASPSSVQVGDVVTLTLPMPVRFMQADPRVKDDVNRVAVLRGPVVYCVEGVDVSANVMQLAIQRDTQFTVQYDESLLGGVSTLHGKLLVQTKKPLYTSLREAERFAAASATVDAQLVPYYAWNNRGVSQMAVWLSLVD